MNIFSCSFENNEKSKSAIHLISEKEGNQIQIYECSFKGELKKGEYFIDGNFVGSKNSKDIDIQSCKFDRKMDVAVNSNMLIQNKNLTILTKTSIALIFSITAIVVSMMIVIMKKKRYNSIEQNNDDFIEIGFNMIT